MQSRLSAPLGPSPPSAPGTPYTVRLLIPDATDVADDPRTPQPDWPFSRFVEEYYIPVVLVHERESAAATITICRNMTARVVQLLDDPPLLAFNDFQIADFKQRSLATPFRRGPLGVDRAYSPAAINKHLRALHAVLVAAVEEGLLNRMPRFPGQRRGKRPRPKPAIPLDDLRLIFDEAKRGDWPHRRKPTDDWPLLPPFATWWQAYFALLFFTGFRADQTLLVLTWSMVRDAEGAHSTGSGQGSWLDVPDEAVPKTDKGRVKLLHPEARGLIEKLRGQGSGVRGHHEKILGRPFGYDQLVKIYRRLGAAAGLPPERVRSPQAWRRSHIDQMAELGFHEALDIARRTADHSDAQTTLESYSDVEAKAIRRLPRLGERSLF